MSKNNPIVKLTYTHQFFDVSEMRIGGKTITTITEDGIIIVRDYKPGSRKAYSTKHTVCSIEQFQELCNKLEDCIETANNWDLWVDDCSEELKLFYKYNRIQIVDRGLGNDDTAIGVIMREFLSKLCFD